MITFHCMKLHISLHEITHFAEWKYAFYCMKLHIKLHEITPVTAWNYSSHFTAWKHTFHSMKLIHCMKTHVWLHGITSFVAWNHPFHCMKLLRCMKFTMQDVLKLWTLQSPDQIWCMLKHPGHSHIKVHEIHFWEMCWNSISTAVTRSQGRRIRIRMNENIWCCGNVQCMRYV